MKPHGFVQVVRKWRDLCTDRILRCLDDLEGLNNGYLPSGRVPQVPKLTNGLRPGTILLSQDLSGAWVTIHG
jgi:hypothetical protein